MLSTAQAALARDIPNDFSKLPAYICHLNTIVDDPDQSTEEEAFQIVFKKLLPALVQNSQLASLRKPQSHDITPWERHANLRKLYGKISYLEQNIVTLCQKADNPELSTDAQAWHYSWQAVELFIQKEQSCNELTRLTKIQDSIERTAPMVRLKTAFHSALTRQQAKAKNKKPVRHALALSA